MKQLLASIFLVLFAVAAAAQDQSNTTVAGAEPSPEFLSPVIVDGDTLFVVRGSSALPANERAKRVQNQIIEAATSSDADSVDIEMTPDDFGIAIHADGVRVTVVTLADADHEQFEIDVVATLKARAIEEAILAYRANRSQSARVDSAISALAWSLAFVVITYLFFARRRKFLSFVQRIAEQRFDQVEQATKSIVRGRAIATLVAYLVHVAMWIAYLVLFYFYLSFVLLSFAETRPAAELLLKYVSAPMIAVLNGFIGYLPNLIMLGIIGVVTKYLIDGVKIFFDNLEQGIFEIPEFERHWIGPTFFLVRILIVLIALVFAYPYIPGSNSRAFQGLTIIAGVMVSLGSNTVVSNMMAGLFVIYRRSTNVGDRIQIGDKTGDVVEIKLMETVIKSVKNEMISIPNAQLLNSEVVNYTRKVDGRGILVHTTVGIGYEEPPQKIKAMLIEAANRTSGLKKSPPPFVLWTQLADYAINYEINAFSSRGGSLPKVKSDLHENIVDVFNENGTQIMTPSYIADPDIPKIPEQAWDGKLAHETDQESGG